MSLIGIQKEGTSWHEMSNIQAQVARCLDQAVSEVNYTHMSPTLTKFLLGKGWGSCVRWDLCKLNMSQVHRPTNLTRREVLVRWQSHTQSFQLDITPESPSLRSQSHVVKNIWRSKSCGLIIEVFDSFMIFIPLWPRSFTGLVEVVLRGSLTFNVRSLM